MPNELRVGLAHTISYKVDRRLTVPEIFPDYPNTTAMPEVLATGFLVALMERACIEAMAPHLQPGEGSLGVDIQLKHLAPTLVGMTVTVEAQCTSVEGRSSAWRVEARDELAKIGEGTHERAIVAWERFERRLGDMRTKVAFE